MPDLEIQRLMTDDWWRSLSQRDVINKCTWERSLINSLELNQKPKVQGGNLALARRTW